MELSIVRMLIDQLNDNNIKYCHWKSNEHVANIFVGIDDIDILVSQSDLLKFNIILNELGYKRFRLPEKRSYIGIEDYLGYDIETGKLVHLHLHYQLTLGEKFIKGYQLPYAESVLNRRIYDKKNDIYISCHEDELWLLLIRTVLKIRKRDYLKFLLNLTRIDQTTKKEFNWLQKRVNYRLFSQITNEMFGTEVSHELIKIYKEGLQFKKVNKLRGMINRRFRPFKTYSMIGGNIVRWSREVFRVRQLLHNKFHKGAKSYRRTPISGGKIISILGPDGAGKSSVIKAVVSKLESYMDVEHIYLGSGDGKSSMLRKPLKLLYDILLKRGKLNRTTKRINSSGQIYYVSERGDESTIRKLGKIPWVLTLSYERKKKMFRARKFRNKGYIVITDRYPQTQVLDMADGPRFYLKDNKKNGLIRKILIKFEKKSFAIADIARPDMVIKLRVTSEIAYNRKPDEIDIESHKILMEKILELDFGENTKHIIVNADEPFESVVNEVTSHIWRCL